VRRAWSAGYAVQQQDRQAKQRREVTIMGDPLQSSNAWTMGNLGLSTVLRDEFPDDRDDVDDLGSPAPAVSWWVRLRGRAIRFSLTAAVVLAYVNHWPSGN
jgi:hypothetical protein